MYSSPWRAGNMGRRDWNIWNPSESYYLAQNKCKTAKKQSSARKSYGITRCNAPYLVHCTVTEERLRDVARAKAMNTCSFDSGLGFPWKFSSPSRLSRILKARPDFNRGKGWLTLCLEFYGLFVVRMTDYQLIKLTPSREVNYYCPTSAGAKQVVTNW